MSNTAQADLGHSNLAGIDRSSQNWGKSNFPVVVINGELSIRNVCSPDGAVYQQLIDVTLAKQFILVFSKTYNIRST